MKRASPLAATQCQQTCSVSSSAHKQPNPNGSVDNAQIEHAMAAHTSTYCLHDSALTTSTITTQSTLQLSAHSYVVLTALRPPNLVASTAHQCDPSVADVCCFGKGIVMVLWGNEHYLTQAPGDSPKSWSAAVTFDMTVELIYT